MKIEKFENIESWKEARLLVKDVYNLLQRCQDRSYKDQIQRASVSVMSNIAEGFDRGTNREFIQFLVIARGSVSEIRSLAYAGADIGYLDGAAFDCISGRCTKLISLINGFIRFLRNTDRKC